MDSTLSALTASTPGTAGLLYAVQGGADRKLSMTAAGATLLEAANAAAQLTALGAATLGANTFTGAQTISAAFAYGATRTAGMTLANTTAATNGTQQTPPTILFSGNRWDTTSSASEEVQMRMGMLPVQQDEFGSYMTGAISLKDVGAATGWVDAIAMRLQNSSQAAICIGGTDWSSGHVYIGKGNRNFNTDFEGVKVSLNGNFAWTSASGGDFTPDLLLTRDSAATLQMGADAAGVVNQTFKACDRITSDGVGANLTIAGGRNRGASDGGSIIFQTSPQSTAGVTGTLTTRLTINADGITTFAKPSVLPSYTVAGLPATAANGAVQGAHAFVTDATAPTYLGALTGGGAVVCPVFYNGSAWVSH